MNYLPHIDREDSPQPSFFYLGPPFKGIASFGIVLSDCRVCTGNRNPKHKPIRRARAHGRPPESILFKSPTSGQKPHRGRSHGRPPDHVATPKNTATAHVVTSNGDISVRSYCILHSSSVLGSVPTVTPPGCRTSPRQQSRLQLLRQHQNT